MDFCLLIKNVGKNICKNISKNLSGQYSPGIIAMRQKLLHHAKQPATDAFKPTSKRVIQKTAEATGGLIGNKTANIITKTQKNSQENNSETVTNDHDKEIPRER